MHIELFYILTFVSLILFLQAFFPLQSNHNTKNYTLPLSLNSSNFDINFLYKPEINRLILIVIDALRTDFISNDSMPHLVSAFEKRGCFLTVQVASPTVTLPRIKSLTTGTIPQFIDIILNLAGTQALSDSFLHRAKNAGKNILFYGDDTWLKLFPNIFKRYKGVTSFYVNDFKEVDYNVTKYVKREVSNIDWDIMVLHYLGLDHIGHVYGPKSVFVRPKLQEMDEVFEMIHSKYDDQTMICVTGDHGMKDGGGHGGATYEETHVPFVVTGLDCKNDSVLQVDISPTLSVLMGIPISFNNVGRVVTNLLNSYSIERLLYALYYNALTLTEKTNEVNAFFHEAVLLHKEFLEKNNASVAKKLQNYYEDITKTASKKLVEASVRQNTENLLFSTLFSMTCFLIALRTYSNNVYSKKDNVYLLLTLVCFCFVIFYFWLKIFILILCSFFLCKNVLLVRKSLRIKLIRFNIQSFIVFGCLLHMFSLLSSSFIEEEHQTWYFLNTSIFLIVLTNISNVHHCLGCVLALISIRFLRALNQTGDKYAHLSDLSDWLSLKENRLYLIFLIAISLILIWYYVTFSLQNSKYLLYLNTAGIFFLFLLHVTSGPIFVMLIRFVIFLNFCIGIMCKNNNFKHCLIIQWILMSALLMRSYNLILIPACIYCYSILCKSIFEIKQLSVICIWLGKLFFFLQGHSNSFASVDISRGYIGLKEYVPFIVIGQVVCHTCIFPILLDLLLLCDKHNESKDVLSINILYRLCNLMFLCVQMLIHRYHLFVWTVFAPKLLIESFHFCIFLFEIFLFYIMLFVVTYVCKFWKNKNISFI